jgi:hypothetical protein
MGEAVLAMGGEALNSKLSFQALSDYDRDSIIEFLKSLQILLPSATSLVVDENYQKKAEAEKMGF